jgi:hypothetical protein
MIQTKVAPTGATFLYVTVWNEAVCLMITKFKMRLPACRQTGFAAARKDGNKVIQILIFNFEFLIINHEPGFCKRRRRTVAARCASNT